MFPLNVSFLFVEEKESQGDHLPQMEFQLDIALDSLGEALRRSLHGVIYSYLYFFYINFYAIKIDIFRHVYIKLIYFTMRSGYYICCNLSLLTIGILLSSLIFSIVTEITTKPSININDIYRRYGYSFYDIIIAVGVTSTVCIMIAITLAFYKGTIVMYSESSNLIHIIDKTIKDPLSDMEDISSAKEIPLDSSKTVPLKIPQSSSLSIDTMAKLLQQMQERTLALEKRTVEVEQQANNLTDAIESEENRIDLTEMPPAIPQPPKRNPPRRGRSLSTTR
jgi:hypothetical protein